MRRRELMNYYRAHTISMYWKWWNDYLTIGYFAEAHGITEHQATRLINIGRVKYHRSIEK